MGIKKISILFMCLVVIIGTKIPVVAGLSEESMLGVYSPEYPDAYLIIQEDTVAQNKSADKFEHTVKVTAFIEEKYDVQDGQLVITESRLLSEEEVRAIGEDNFDNFKRPSVSTRAATNSKGKLTITCSGSHSTSGNSLTANLTGTAKWSGFYTISNPELEPSSGDDYCGFAWAGGFDLRSSSASASTALGNLQVYAAESSPNAGKVWSFKESIYAGDSTYGMNNSSFKATLYKANLTGNGNTASAVFKYIHTYQAHTGSISISASTSGVGAGFSLSGVSKQWSLVCTINSIPY